MAGRLPFCSYVVIGIVTLCAAMMDGDGCGVGSVTRPWSGRVGNS